MARTYNQSASTLASPESWSLVGSSPCAQGSTALALARVTSMRTFGGEGREGEWIRRCQGRKGLAQPSHLHIPDRGREPRGIQSAVQRARRAPWTGGGHGAEVDRAPPGRCRARLRSHRPKPSSASRQSPPGQRPGSRRRARRGQAALLSALGQSRRQLTTEGRDADGSVCCGVEREVGLEAAVDERAADEAAKRPRLRRGRPHPYRGGSEQG